MLANAKYLLLLLQRHDEILNQEKKELVSQVAGMEGPVSPNGPSWATYVEFSDVRASPLARLGAFLEGDEGWHLE